MDSFKELMDLPSLAPLQQQCACLLTSRGGLGLPHVLSYAAIARAAALLTAPRTQAIAPALETWVNAERECLFLTLQPFMANHPSTFFGDLTTPPEGRNAAAASKNARAHLNVSVREFRRAVGTA